MKPKTDQLVGAVLASQFRILARLGEGGMGAVYLAEQADMGRRVVIKVMHPELTAGGTTAIERFKREARAVAALNHPNIVQVYVFGQADDGRLYLAMEYVDGRDLGAEIKAGPIAAGRALKILDQVAAALTEAHSRGIVHRDLKPENIMLAQRHGNPDWVKVLDFGIAKLAAQEGAREATALTQAGAIFGTPRYMAPEQITGGSIDARTDLYALGIIFYEMLVGEHPFRANSAMDYLLKHVEEEVVLPRTLRPDLRIAPAIDAILARLLAKSPNDRFQSAAELQRELRQAMVQSGEELSHTVAISASALYERASTGAFKTLPPAQPRANRKLPWLIGGVAILGGLVIALVAAVGGKDVIKPPEPEPAPDTRGAQADSLGAEADTRGAVVEADTAASADTASADAAGAPPKLRAGSPIEGFPVPDGMTLASSEEMVLRLETTADARDVLDFYKAELAGRMKPIANGFEITDATSPWALVVLYRSGDRLALVVSRRIAAQKQPEP